MRGLIAWFACHPVAANLLMGILLVGGALSLTVLRQESFPELIPEQITVSVEYPGATPSEVEESICIKIEEAVQGLEGIDRLYSKASENLGVVTVEITDDADIRTVLDDVKAEIDAIDTFPDDAEQPTIKEQRVEERVISVALSGDVDERTLRVFADEVRDDLLRLPGISKAELVGARQYEISIEVREDVLRQYRLTFDDVANAVRRYSVNLPAGSVKTEGGEILFRSDAQAYDAHGFERIPVRTLSDGTRITVGDVASVIDGFQDTDQSSRFDGQPALTVQVFRIGRQSTPDVAREVLAYVEKLQARLPTGVSATIWQDRSQTLRERLDLLAENGLIGLALVFVALALFLEARLALWVAVGLSAAVFGTVWVMPAAGQSLNLLSSFGFIVVLGILVDDAIVVSENIDAHRKLGSSAKDAAIRGTWEVMVPVSLAVITTGIAFSPMLQLPGRTGVFAGSIAVVVIIAISFSLLESLLILPAHLRHEGKKRTGWLAQGWNRFQGRFTGLLRLVIVRLYRPSLRYAMSHRYFTLAVGLAFLVLTAGLLAGGRVKISFFPPIEDNNVIAGVTLPEGSSVAESEAVARQLLQALERVREEKEPGERGSVVRHVLATIGDQPGRATSGPPDARGPTQSRANLIEVHVELVSAQERDVLASEVAAAWRDEVGSIPDAVEVVFSSDRVNTGAPINVELSGDDIDAIRAASESLKRQLGTYSGTFNIADDYRSGKVELALDVTPSGESLGLTQRDVARQVRQGFYGEEAQRVQIGKNEVKVFVRYPEGERRSLANLENMRVRLPAGGEAPFAEVAEYRTGRGAASINRLDRQRTIVVTSDLSRSVANANDIVADLSSTFLPELQRSYPTVRIAFGGEQTRQSESFGSLRNGMILAFLLMFALLSLVFRSYVQPLIVLSAIPFGWAGAVWAHYALGMNLTFMSMIGFLALMGVVVNDSLVLIDFINRFRRDRGMDAWTAVQEGGPRRFRAILLTSLTTFAGLTPIMLERSVQATFLIPMAVSLAYGLVFATFVILVLVPAAYLALEDLKSLVLRRSADTGTPDPDLPVREPVAVPEPGTVRSS